MKAQLGITDALASCHTATVAGYVIEGHVPAGDITRLLAERPDALGLSVPDMPIGSPGMQMGDNTEPFTTLLIQPDGSSEMFAHHG
ncbi:putative metal-binding protein [Phaeobacter porticola]|uniref:Putative metal-binding protein n=1 Tax=Phaeobacter porticola TaxID=1844006 RepID=A0A1L3I186_9RHOB|nr:putative metal-binding protein [Phaeobacter porticola]